MSQPSLWPKAMIRRDAATFIKVKSLLQKLFDDDPSRPQNYQVCLQIRTSDPDWLLLDLRNRCTLGRYDDAGQTNWLFSGTSYAALMSRTRSLEAMNLRKEARDELHDLLQAIRTVQLIEGSNRLDKV
jgi:hypothetical protein